MSEAPWVKGVVLHLTIATETSIRDLIWSALQVSNRIGCMTSIDLNGVRVLAAPGDDHETLVSNWMLAKNAGVGWASSTHPQRGSQN